MFSSRIVGKRYLSECLRASRVHPAVRSGTCLVLALVRISVALVTASGYPQSLRLSGQENLWVCFSFLATSLKARYPNFGQEMLSQTWLILLISCYGLSASQALCSPAGEGTAPRASVLWSPYLPISSFSSNTDHFSLCLEKPWVF